MLLRGTKQSHVEKPSCKVRDCFVPLNNKKKSNNVLFLSSADKLRAKTGRTMVARAAAGHRKFLLKRWECAAKQRVNVSSPGSAGFAALDMCGKEAFLLT